MKLVATNTFTTELITHGSWGSRDLGQHESTMELHISDDKVRGFIAWEIPTLEESEEIGLWLEEKYNFLSLIDYDGTMSLPKEAIELLRANGVVVDKIFE